MFPLLSATPIRSGAPLLASRRVATSLRSIRVAIMLWQSPPHLMNDNKSAHSLSFKPAFSANLLNLKHLYVPVTVIKMIQ